jgi:7-cyano-7-deazaguanine synthase
MANLATKASVEGKVRFEIHTPLIKLSKAEIIKTGTELGVDYSLTWSCYDPEAEHSAESAEYKLYSPCMKCDSCLFRAKGFQEAGIIDPLAVIV